MGAQKSIEFIRALLGEEESCSIQDFYFANAGDGVVQPVRPALGEENIIISPYDQRWFVEPLEVRVDSQRLFMVHGGRVAIDSGLALCRGGDGPEIHTQHVIREAVGELKGHPQTALGSGDIGIRQETGEGLAELPRVGELE